MTIALQTLVRSAFRARMQRRDDAGRRLRLAVWDALVALDRCDLIAREPEGEDVAAVPIHHEPVT